MRNKRKRLSLYVFIGALVLFGGLFPKKVAFAGGINGNEAGVISAASGTFTYNGKTYRAGSAYINQLVSYLSGDDVDLTADQASQAISQMYASIQQGVEEGYLYEVETPTAEEVSTEEQTSEETTEKTEKADKKDKDKKKDKKDKDKETGSTTEAVLWETVAEQTIAEEKLEQRPKEKEAEASVSMDNEKIIVTTKDNKEIQISRNGKPVSEKYLRVIQAIAGSILIVTLGCGVILFGTKCMSFRKPRNRRSKPGHSKRRKIRRYTRNVLIGTTAMSLMGTFLFFGIYVSLFNENAVMQSMQQSGYFRYAYSEYIAELSEQSKADDIQPYEEYRFMIKQNSLKVLRGETDVRIPDSNVTPYIYNLKKSYMELFKTAGSFVILSVILGILLMIFMDQRRERGIKSAAVATLAASIVMAVITLVMAAGKPYMHIYIEPDYLYLFLMECIHWSVKVMTSITAFAVVAGTALIGAYRTVVSHR